MYKWAEEYKIASVSIIKTKRVSHFLVSTIIVILLTATVFAGAIDYNWNELASRDVTDALAYSWGYDEGYENYGEGKAAQPLTTFNKWKRISYDDPDYLGAELAAKEKAMYVKGYRDGYTEARKGMQRAVSDDFLEEFGLKEKEETQKVLGTVLYGGWNLDELDTEQGIENLAYEIGYTDAKEGNAKSPLKIMYDLAKEERSKVRTVYEWIRENRGTVIKKYKEGYEAYLEEKKSVTTETKVHGQSSKLASQQTGTEQKEAAYDVGYKLGYAAGSTGEASRPQTILNYDWILNARYSKVGIYEHESRDWYTLPVIAGIQITKQDVAEANADDRWYLKGYREGYDTGKKEQKGEEESLSDAEYVYQLGCTLAQDGVNPFTYNWYQRYSEQTPEDIDLTKLVRYNRAKLLRGYRDCK